MGNGVGKTCILNLLDIPHFGRSAEINICVKLLLICVHGLFLWLDRPVSIDIELIAWITGFPSKGEDPSLLFTKQFKGESIGRNNEGQVQHIQRCM
jgi:hypothetical protein